MGNSIPQRQSEPRQIEYLRAQRCLYSTAKKYLAFQSVLIGATPLISAVLVALWRTAEPWVGLWGIFLTAADALILDVRQEKFKELAGKVQETFDCAVLEMDWNVLLGSRPSPEEIRDWSAHCQKADSSLADWYHPSVAVVELPLGRLICQRTNCAWDSQLRGFYIKRIEIILMLIAAATAGLGIWSNMSVQKLVLAILAPLMPAAMFAIRERRRQVDAAIERKEAWDNLEEMWRKFIGGELDMAKLAQRSRAVQDQIYHQRCTHPLVPDWVYRTFRARGEDQVSAGVKSLIADVRQHRPDKICD